MHSPSPIPEGYPPSLYAATAIGIVARPDLTQAIDADVCIVGGGFTGLSAALHLAQQGVSVVVLEAERAGWGASGRNGGQLHSGQRRDPYWLEDQLGKAEARKLWTLGEASKQLVRSLIAEFDIDCDYQPGLIHVRAKIEALLPKRLGVLARLADSFRGAVASLMPSADDRRYFWARFFAGPVSHHALAGNMEKARSEANRLLNRNEQSEGYVWLVGAGPGAEDLLTLRAQRVLQEADVIVHDRLVPDVVVAMV